MQQTYCAVLRRQQQLPVEVKHLPEVALLACALCYLIKGLVKQPDPMSASVQMASGLFLLARNKSYGFPALRVLALEESLDRVIHDVHAEGYRILHHMDFNRPGGNIIKSSRLIQAIPPPDRLLTPPITPAPPTNVTSAVPVWSQQDDAFLDQLVNQHLPKVLWRRFPEAYLCSESADVVTARSRSMRRSDWPKIVEATGRYEVAKKVKFSQTLEKLFPPNWAMQKSTPDMQALDDGIWTRIRARIEKRPPPQRTKYDEMLRTKLTAAMLENWEFLPVIQAHRIWSYRNEYSYRYFKVCSRW